MSLEDKKNVLIIDNLFNIESDNLRTLINVRSHNLCKMLCDNNYNCTYISSENVNCDSDVTFKRLKYPEEIISFIKESYNNDEHFDLIINNGELYGFYNINLFLRDNIDKSITIIDKELSYDYRHNDINIQIIKSDVIVFSNENDLQESNLLLFVDDNTQLLYIDNNDNEKYIELINELLG